MKDIVFNIRSTCQLLISIAIKNNNPKLHPFYHVSGIEWLSKLYQIINRNFKTTPLDKRIIFHIFLQHSVIVIAVNIANVGHTYTSFISKRQILKKHIWLCVTKYRISIVWQMSWYLMTTKFFSIGSCCHRLIMIIHRHLYVRFLKIC